MSELVESVDSLEVKLRRLLQKMELLQHANLRLEEELNAERGHHGATKLEVRSWQEKYDSLKLASAMLGSDTNKTEAKLKINALIRELDHCIVQLSE